MISRYEFKKRGHYLYVEATSLGDALCCIRNYGEYSESDINSFKVSVNGGRFRRVSKCLG